MTTRPAHIVIVEDDPVTRSTLASYLGSFGYQVSECDNAEKAERLLAREEVNLLIVDINLSGKDGLEITREQRARSEIGIILLSGLSDDVDRIVGLELGADDYVCKPFNRRELLARVKNLLRRTAAIQALDRRVFHFAGFTFDVSTRHLSDAAGIRIPLTPGEYDLLRVFLVNPGVVLGRDRLMTAIRHRQGFNSTRTIDVLVQRLRAKLDDDPKAPRILTTQHGEGYVFTATLG